MERHSQKALFVQTNNTTANQIMVYDRAWNGTLTFAASYATGGKGATASGATADPLASQGSLASADHGPRASGGQRRQQHGLALPRAR